jgi:hypothetical protein
MTFPRTGKRKRFLKMAGVTGLEPAASAVTGHISPSNTVAILSKLCFAVCYILRYIPYVSTISAYWYALSREVYTAERIVPKFLHKRFAIQKPLHLIGKLFCHSLHHVITRSGLFEVLRLYALREANKAEARLSEPPNSFYAW